MRRLLFVLALVPAPALGQLRHFDVSATFEAPRKPGATANVSVSFRALDPDLRLNESPAPRLKLDLAQAVLVDKQAPAAVAEPDYDPLLTKYRDLDVPVLFPVAIAPTAPKGEQRVKASVVFFYCSQREAWCRRGSAEVEIPVSVQ